LKFPKVDFVGGNDYFPQFLRFLAATTKHSASSRKYWAHRKFLVVADFVWRAAATLPRGGEGIYLSSARPNTSGGHGCWQG